jgi:uncharacterized delta-60 repeat protein
MSTNVRVGRQRAARANASAAEFETLGRRWLLSAGALDPTFGKGGVVVEPTIDRPDGLVVEANGNILVSTSSQLLCYNADGTPDTSFGKDGAISPDFNIAGVAVQSNGQIVLGGSAGGGWAVARYNADGTPDTTFGTNGQTITHVNGSTGESAAGVGIAGDGDILIGGTQANPEFVGPTGTMNFFGAASAPTATKRRLAALPARAHRAG